MLALSAGCSGLAGDAETQSRLDLTVQNDRDRSVSVGVTVTDADGAVLVDESDRIGSGVARAFEFAVGTTGRHEVAVAGDDWRGQLAWDAGACARYEATVRVTPESVDVAGECVERQ